MITLTLEALYTLQMMNDQSKDLVFLPLPALLTGQTRKEQLRKVLEKGYHDLEKVGLLKDNKPTDDFVRYGYYVSLYSNNYYHFQVDSNYFCAPGVDKEKRMAVIIKKVGDNDYIIDYFNTIALLSILLENHEILHHLDDKHKNYLKAEWEPYAYFRLLAYYGDAKTIRLKVEQLGKIYSDTLFFNSKKSGLFEYDMLRQQIRSVSVSEMKHILLSEMKVRA